MAERIKTILVDDQPDNLTLLENQIAKTSANIEIIDEAMSVQEAVTKINNLEPDLVFLDIKLPDGKGFDVINQVENDNFQVIFVTAYEEYAIKAFEFSALHYLLKPVSLDELQKALERFESSRRDENFENQLTTLTENLNSQNKKIILPASDGLSIIELDDIVHLESSNNYTSFYLNNGERIMVSKPISTYERLLSDLYFARIHNKHIINLKYVKKYVRGRGGYVVLTDNSHVDVSEGRKKGFLEKLKRFARN